MRGVSVISSKRSGALRLREGRVLGAGAGFLGAGFRAAGVLGTEAFFVVGLALTLLRALLLAVFLGGGESSTSSSPSSRLRLLEGGEARFAVMLEVAVRSGESDSLAASGVVVETGSTASSVAVLETGSMAASVAVVGTGSMVASIAVVEFDPARGFSADVVEAPGNDETARVGLDGLGESGGEERGDESTVDCDIANVFVGVVEGSAVFFRDV